MKILFAVTATMLILGQAAVPVGLPSWLGSFSQLSAVGLMGYILYFLVTKEMPRERNEARESAKVERDEAREHTERLVSTLAEEHRQDRKKWAEQLSTCRLRDGD